MHILLLSELDNANAGFETARSLRTAGHTVNIWKRRTHPFKYREEAPLTDRSWGDLVREFKPDVVHLITGGDVKQFLKQVDTIDFPKGVLPVVQHSGTVYRTCMKWWDEQIDSRFKALILARTADLMHHPRAKLFIAPVDTEVIPPHPHLGHTIIGHYPSRPEIKGTSDILSIMCGLKCELRHGGGPVPWIEHLKRVAECDVIVETLKPELRGERFGEGGMSGIEAAALGCVVITNSFAPHHYEAAYGETAHRHANSKGELRDHLVELLALDRNALEEERLKSRAWAEEKHSHKPTGRYLTRLYEEAQCDLL